MQNITISIDENVVRLTEARAAEAGKSVSDFIGELVAREVGIDPAKDNPQLQALRRVFSRPLLPLSENGRLPDANERNARG